jgi:hypothetical protein
MKHLLSIGLFTTIVFGACNSSGPSKNFETKAKEINSDTLAYDVIKSVLIDEEKTKNIKTEFVLSKENMGFPFSFKEDSISLVRLDSLFSAKDIEYIFSQKKAFEAFALRAHSLQGKTLISADSIEKYKTYISIGLPLFNQAQNLAIVRVSYYCGMLCGYSNIYIYKNLEGRWMRIKVIQEAIS